MIVGLQRRGCGRSGFGIDLQRILFVDLEGIEKGGDVGDGCKSGRGGRIESVTKDGRSC